MPVTATGLAALFLEDIRSGLAQCETMQEIFAVDGEADPEAALAALLFIGDAGEALTEPYGLLTCTPRGSEQVASGLRRYSFEARVEIWTPQPVDADDAEEDFIASHNLSEVVTELWALADNGVLDFELTGIESGEPVRDEEVGAGRGTVGNILVIAGECYNE
jgi:hypothetical protein